MSNTSIFILVHLPYIHQSILVEVPKDCQGKQVLELIRTSYPSKIEVLYLYDAFNHAILDLSETLQAQGIDQGSVLYCI